jgi:hypothetical protein
MSAHATFGIGREKDAWRAPLKALRLEKSPDSGASHGEDSTNEEVPDRRGAKPTRRMAYHFETAGLVPHWNGPILDTAFAAQVIGQALNAHEDAQTSARLAYRNTAQIGRAFLFDDSV